MIDTQIYRISGSVATTVLTTPDEAIFLSSSGFITSGSKRTEGGVNFRKKGAKRNYNNLLLGQALRTDIGPLPSSGTLAGTYSPITDPPSWTQYYAGKRDAFVISPVSSSQHEVSVLNAWYSGSTPYETSAVPASSSLYYTKSSRFNTLVMKVTGSTSLAATMGDTFVANSGVLLNSYGEHKIPFQVTQQGRIRDIRVWIEITMESGSNGSRPLDSVAIVLRSPNVNFYCAHPFFNDTKAVLVNRQVPSVLNTDLAGDFKQSSYIYGSYLLWEGGYKTDFDNSPGNPVFSAWGKNRNMRTIFTDSSLNLNPFFFSFTGAMYSSAIEGSSGLGNDVPWTTDQTITSQSVTYLSAGSPPPGWLSGPGGTNNTNEWPTTGSNLGPATIKPALPLLDDIFAIGKDGNHPVQIRGFRPGLRNTEMLGKWELVVDSRTILWGDGSPGTVNANSPNIYFRQARLEFVYDTGKVDISSYSLTRGLRNKRSGFPAESDWNSFDVVGTVYPQTRVFSYSPLPSAEPASIKIVVPGRSSNYRTSGITDDTGSLTAGNFAVFTRITGALGNLFTGSNYGGARYAFLHNEFGTPHIPLSSGSGIPITGEFAENDVDRAASRAVLDLIDQRTTITPAQDIDSILSAQGVIVSAAAAAEKLISASTGST